MLPPADTYNAMANIAELRSRIDAEVRRVSGGVGVTNTINKQREAQVKRELAQVKMERDILKKARYHSIVVSRTPEGSRHEQKIPLPFKASESGLKEGFSFGRLRDTINLSLARSLRLNQGCSF